MIIGFEGPQVFKLFRNFRYLIMNSFSVVESYRSLLRIGASFDKTGVDCSLFNVDVLDPKLRLLASS